MNENEKDRQFSQDADEPEAAGAKPDVGPDDAEEKNGGQKENYDQLMERFLRARADAENMRKRLERKMQEEVDHAIEDFAADLLPVADNLARAIQAALEHDSAEKILEGVQLVEKQLYDALSRHGVKPVEVEVGQQFDPNEQEAMTMIPSDEHPANNVVQELQRGFRIRNRLLRPARVVVSSGPPEEPQASDVEAT